MSASVAEHDIQRERVHFSRLPQLYWYKKLNCVALYGCYSVEQ